MFKCLLKTASGTLRFDLHFPFKDLIIIQVSAKSSYFVGVQKFIHKILSGTIWFDPYFFSMILYKCSTNAHIFFGVKNLLAN